MNSIGDFSGERKTCPYGEKCYRKNLIHFNEMSHPHLEKLIINQLDSESISLPENLDFECEDRLKLLDQLELLQKVMKKIKSRNSSGTSKTDNANTEATSKSTCQKSSSTKAALDKEKEEKSKKLKEKVEKHKEAHLKKRKHRLDAMDDQATTFKNKNLESPSKKPKNSSKISESNSSSCSQDKSPIQSSSYSSSSKIKTETSTALNKNPAQSSSYISSSKTIIETSMVSNEREVLKRKKDATIARMLQAGQKINLVPEGEFALKYALSAPYHYFLCRVEKEEKTYNQNFTVTFPELLDISLGEIVNSLHINFMVEVSWLCIQYLFATQNAKMTIFCGEVVDSQVSFPPYIKIVHVEVPGAFGCHHSKVSVLQYKDGGIRILVSTANLYSDDWENRVQGIWMSPHLPKLPESASDSHGDSPTGFKNSFRRYLQAYQNSKLNEWVELVKRADFSAINVFFVASVPGSHQNININLWGHRRLGGLLKEHAVLPVDASRWPIIAQSSSIGSLGPNYESWISSNIVFAMAKEKEKGIKADPSFRFIYPSLKNYEESYDCKAGSCCLPYSRKSNDKQQWLKDYLYQWKADSTGRTKAMPHIKSYTRLSPDGSQIPWFVLTSANLSKGAWGTVSKNESSHYIMNYEAGVLFLPKFIINQNTFPIKESCSPDIPTFRLPYDLPLTKYGQSDKIFVQDYLSDRH